jgi:hypothetical protein
MRAAVQWLKDPAHFPNGSAVVIADVYEFTDRTADLSSCVLGGFMGSWPEGGPVLAHLEEQYMKIVVDARADMIFMAETFCGHGFHAADTASPCYRGPGSPVWFDFTCFHPTPDGHTQIADLFMDTINGGR